MVNSINHLQFLTLKVLGLEIDKIQLNEHMMYIKERSIQA